MRFGKLSPADKRNIKPLSRERHRPRRAQPTEVCEFGPLSGARTFGRTPRARWQMASTSELASSPCVPLACRHGSNQCHPPGPPMTLGNMRAQGVSNLIAFCLNDACRHQAVLSSGAI